MHALKLEAHFFVREGMNPEPKDIPSLIEKFSGFDLMPQYFEEQNLATQQKSKRMSFTNPITNKSVFFHSDKILFTEHMNPMATNDGNVGQLLSQFWKFVEACINACSDFAQGRLVGHRVSFVADFVKELKGDTAESALAEKMVDAVNWCDSAPTEIRLRTGELVTMNSVSEKVNVLITVNDGVIERSIGNISDKKNCFLVQVDVNTKPDIKDSRFSRDISINTWKEMSDIAVERLDRVSNYFDRK